MKDIHDIRDFHNLRKIKLSSSLSFKVGVSVFVFSFIYFICVIGFSGYTNTIFSTSAIAERNYCLARTIAVSLPQEYPVRLFKQVREIYDSLPSDVKDDYKSPGYKKLFEPVFTDEYYTLRQTLIKNVDNNLVSWINFHIEDSARNKVIFVIDSDIMEDGRYDAGWQGSLDNYIHSDRNLAEYTVHSDPEYGQTIIVRAPFYDPGSGEILGYVSVGERERNVTTNNIAFLLFFGLILLVLTLIFIVTSVGGIRRMVIDPIILLSEAATRFSKKQDRETSSHVFKDLGIRSNDEIGLLASSMASMEEDIHGYVDNLKNVTREKERIATELDVASRIQKSMLPSELTGYNGKLDFSISALSRSAKEMGGDFYDFFAIDDDHIGITVADVSDKGIPAALFMVISRTLIKGSALLHHNPSRVMSDANHVLCERNDESMFVTVFFGIYTVSEKKLRYVNAGHEYPAIYRADSGDYSLIEEDHDLVLGIMENVEFNERELQLNSGDRLLLYTDGIPEAINKDGSAYGESTMLACLNRSHDLRGRELLNLIRDDIDTFASGVSQFDDMTMLLLEISPDEPLTE